MTKRIAIQFFGHLRTFEQTFEAFQKNVLDANKQDGYEIDIFLHTWDELDHTTVSYRNDGKGQTQKLTESSIDLAKSYYAPKAMSVEPQRTCEERIIIEKIGNYRRSIKGCLNMSYTLYRGSELRRRYEEETGLTYDWVIVTRPDVLFKTEFRIDDFLKYYQEFDFEIPANVLFCAFNPFGRGNRVDDPRFFNGSDIIYFARAENVNKATSLYENFEKNLDVNDFYCFEVWWTTFWKSQGLVHYPIDYCVWRDFSVFQNDEPPARRKPGKIKTFSRKIKKTVLSFLPYFLVKNKIKKLKAKIEAAK
jgi:hypothetical protein